MKYAILIILIVFLISCTPIEPITITETVIETVTEYVEDTTKIVELEDELDKYRTLINNLNEYLGYVYYGWAENDIGGVEDGFTAFSISYKDVFYLVTAGHAVENEHGRFYNFRFKANFTNEWIYPKLLTYNNDYMNEMDYAIFTGSEIDNGFNVDLDDDRPLFIIGRTGMNIISAYKRKTIEGESGSCVIDADGEVTEIATTDMYSYNTDIDTILEAIDNLE